MSFSLVGRPLLAALCDIFGLHSAARIRSAGGRRTKRYTRKSTLTRAFAGSSQPDRPVWLCVSGGQLAQVAGFFSGFENFL